MSDRPNEAWRKYRTVAFIVGAASAIGCAVLAMWDLNTLLEGYLFAYLAACFATAGFLGLLALGNLTGGKWAVASRPVHLAGVDATPLVAVLFLPIALGVDDIYVWATDAGRHMFEGDSKAVWLSSWLFLVRGVAYLIIWLLLAVLMVRFSSLRRVPGETTGMRRAGSLGLVGLIGVMSMAAFDWGMSLEPQWYSSIYGAILAISGVVAAHATVAIVLCGLHTDLVAPFEALADPPEFSRGPEAAAKVRGDVGNLLLAFVMLWAYFSVSQLLIIWSGNLPSEISWYLARLETSWRWVAIGLVVLHFATPFLLLISRQVKHSARTLRRVALLLVGMYLVNMFWTIKPGTIWSHTTGSGKPELLMTGISISVADVACLLAVGGLWTSMFLWRLERRWTAVIRLAANEMRGTPA